MQLVLRRFRQGLFSRPKQLILTRTTLGVGDPLLGIVVLTVVAAIDPTQDHRPGDPPLFGAEAKVDVGDDERHQRDG